MTGRKIWLGIAGLVLAGFLFLPTMAGAVTNNEGVLLYVADITRTADGSVDTTGGTGALYMKNLETLGTRAMTGYAAGTNVLNPMMTTDGKYVVYTSDASGLFRVYCVNAASTVSNPATGVLIQNATYDVKYAAVNSAFDGKAQNVGVVVYTLAVSTSKTQLWVKDLSTGLSSVLKDEAGMVINNPVFVDADTVAYVGTKNGVQKIYSIDTNGANFQDLTPTNTTPTPQYGRLQSVWRNAALVSPKLVYSKRVYLDFAYGQWDVFVKDLSAAAGSEVNVSVTPDMDELDPSFYGSDVSDPVIGLTGQMFYSADILGDVDIWQANYDRDSASSTNTSKVQRVTSAGIEYGLAAWGPVVPPSSDEDVVSVGDTRFVYTVTAGTITQIARADTADNGATWTSTTLTGTSTPKTNPTLAGTGGTIAFDVDSSTPDFIPDSIIKMNYDSTGYTDFIPRDAPPQEVKMPNLSSDGRWVVYVREGDLFAKNTLGGLDTDLGQALTDAEDPSFNPEMTQIVFRRTGETDPAAEDIYVLSVFIDNGLNTLAPSTVGPINLTETGSAYVEMQPSFSPDGAKIAFVSNKWDNRNQIFVMNARKDSVGAGNALTLVVADAAGTLALAYPTFGAMNDASYVNNYALAYVSTVGAATTIKRGDLAKVDATPNDATNLVVNEQDTGLTPDAGALKFAWGIRRTRGTIIARRHLQTRVPVGATAFTYSIKVDVDEASVPNGFTISELLPGWTVAAANVAVDGVAADANYTSVFDNGDGTYTLKIVFSSAIATAPHNQVKDCYITITPTSAAGAAGDVETLDGIVSYMLDGQATSSSISGGGVITRGNPYMPVDIYNADGDLRTDDTDQGVVEDWDLLYAIDAWAADAQLGGYNDLWPVDITNWDGIILEVIAIWAVMPVGESAGEYQFVTPAPVTPEMFWQTGAWS